MKHPWILVKVSYISAILVGSVMARRLSDKSRHLTVRYLCITCNFLLSRPHHYKTGYLRRKTPLANWRLPKNHENGRKSVNIKLRSIPGSHWDSWHWTTTRDASGQTTASSWIICPTPIYSTGLDQLWDGNQSHRNIQHSTRFTSLTKDFHRPRAPRSWDNLWSQQSHNDNTAERQQSTTMTLSLIWGQLPLGPKSQD